MGIIFMFTGTRIQANRPYINLKYDEAELDRLEAEGCSFCRNMLSRRFRQMLWEEVVSPTPATR